MILNAIVTVLLVALVAFVLWKKRGDYDPGSGWRHYGSDGTRVVEYTDMGRPNFDFGEPHMLTKPISAAGQSVHAKFKITGEGFYPQERPNQPALVTILFERVGADYTGNTPYHRWYSIETAPCVAGVHELEIPFVWGEWVSVLGRNTAGFTTQDIDRIGFGFGHSTGRAHGVRGNGSFELLEFEIR